MPPRINGDADQMYWVLSRSDTFTVKSAYMFVAPSVPSENTHIWNIIWRWKSTQRVCTFMWLIVHNRLKTHWELYRRHIVDGMNCLRCGHDVEDALHAPRDFLFVKRVWEALVP